MAQAEQPDWNVIRELYNKGLTLRQIAEQFGLQVGTVASRASRGNWRATATKASAIAQAVQITVKHDNPPEPESSAITKASSCVKGSLSNALLVATGCLDTLPKSKSLKSRAASAQLLSTLAGVAKTVFGWSEGQSSPSVRIAIMGNTTIATDQQPVIECESVPVLPVPES